MGCRRQLGAQVGVGGSEGLSPMSWTWLLPSPAPWGRRTDLEGGDSGSAFGATVCLFVCLFAVGDFFESWMRAAGRERGRARGGAGRGGRRREEREGGCKNDSVSSAAARPLRLRCQRPGMYSSPLCLTQVRTPLPAWPRPAPRLHLEPHSCSLEPPLRSGGWEKKKARASSLPTPFQARVFLAWTWGSGNS